MITCSKCGENTFRKSPGLCTICRSKETRMNRDGKPLKNRASPRKEIKVEPLIEPVIEKPKRVLTEQEKIKGRNIRLKRKYGLTPDGYMLLYDSQGGKCSICSIPFEPFSKGFFVDHNHSTGKVRGILCNHCNTALGFSKENTKTLAGMIAYILRHRR